MIGERIKEFRKNYKLTQKEMADILDIERSTYTNYERGKILPPIDKITKLADYFNVSLDYLIGRKKLTPDEELTAIFADPRMRVAFRDYKNWTEEDKKELINYLKVKKMARESREND